MEPFRFCPYCSERLVVRVPEGGDSSEPMCERCDFVAYRNAKPCAGALVERDGRVLLVRRAKEPFRDWWDVPGGYVEYEEHPAEAARRELREETGFEIRIVRLLGIYLSQYGPGGQRTIDLIYLAEVAGGEEMPGDDAAAIGWFGPDELPEVAFDSGPASLRDWVEDVNGRIGTTGKASNSGKASKSSESGTSRKGRIDAG